MKEARDEIEAAAARTADTLGETGARARAQIRTACQMLDPELVAATLRDTLAIEAAGGLLTIHGQRRTPGGVFFHLLERRVSPEQRRAIFPKVAPKPRAPSPPPVSPPIPVVSQSPMLFQWSMLDTVLERLGPQPGVAESALIRVAGPPARVIVQQRLVVVGLRSHAPRLPQLPPLLKAPTTYSLLLTHAQWEPLAARAAHPDAWLTVEGYPAFHPRFAGITVYAQTAAVRIRSERGGARSRQTGPPKRDRR